jgi:hypothetical protein
MSKGKVAASRVRWFMLAAAVLCWLVGLFYLINVAWPKWEVIPSRDIREGAGLLGVLGLWTKSESGYWASVGIYVGVFLLTQWLLLCPRGRLRLQVNQTGRPMIVSVVSAGLAAALLSIGLLACVLELAGGWQEFAFRTDVHDTWLSRSCPALLTLAVAWAVWAGLFFLYWRQGDHCNWAGRVLRGLLAGSILELLVAAPAQAFAVRHEKENCYCELGSYTGLVLGGTVLLWCFGPGVALLFLREERRRRELLGTPSQSGALQ